MPISSLLEKEWEIYKEPKKDTNDIRDDWQCVIDGGNTLDIETLYEMTTEEKHEYVSKLTDKEKVDLIIRFLIITEPLTNENFGDDL